MFKRQPKDPNERVYAALAVLAQQNLENNQRGIGLLSMPKYQRAKRDLVGMGSAAVPALVDELTAARESRDTPHGEVEHDVANDIAEVLGDIGDPRAVEPLVAQFKRHVVNAQAALGKFPQGVDALLSGLTDDDDHIRYCCITGLGTAAVQRDRAAEGITRALTSEPHTAERMGAVGGAGFGMSFARVGWA